MRGSLREKRFEMNFFPTYFTVIYIYYTLHNTSAKTSLSLVNKPTTLRIILLYPINWHYQLIFRFQFCYNQNRNRAPKL